MNRSMRGARCLQPHTSGKYAASSLSSSVQHHKLLLEPLLSWSSRVHRWTTLPFVPPSSPLLPPTPIFPFLSSYHQVGEVGTSISRNCSTPAFWCWRKMVALAGAYANRLVSWELTPHALHSWSGVQLHPSPPPPRHLKTTQIGFLTA